MSKVVVVTIATNLLLSALHLMKFAVILEIHVEVLFLCKNVTILLQLFIFVPMDILHSFISTDYPGEYKH